MNNLEIKEELEGLLTILREDEDIRQFSELTNYKDYSSKDIERWATEYKDDPAIRTLYEKIGDILIPRIDRAVADKKMDKGLASLTLKTFHGFTDKTDINHSGGVTINIPGNMAKV